MGTPSFTRAAVRRRAALKAAGLTPTQASAVCYAETAWRQAIRNTCGREVADRLELKVHIADRGPRVTLNVADELLTDQQRELFRRHFGAKLVPRTVSEPA